MNILSHFGKDDLATVFVGENEHGKRLEFVESVQPPRTRSEKWVNIISTSYGCPVGCLFCDAGGHYEGPVSKDELFAQIDTLVRYRFGDSIPASKFWKIQFARMGEPALNPAVLDVLRELPQRYPNPALMPCISTVAPMGRELFFEELLRIRHELYPIQFQLQFSIHTLDWEARKKLVPVKTWIPQQIVDYARAFHVQGGRKTSLNFALTEDVRLSAEELLELFDPSLFHIKLTPINPTFRAQQHKVANGLKGEAEIGTLTDELRQAGYDVLVSIGELEENQIGSNCGQYVSALDRECACELDAYSYSRLDLQD